MSSSELRSDIHDDGPIITLLFLYIIKKGLQLLIAPRRGVTHGRKTNSVNNSLELQKPHPTGKEILKKASHTGKQIQPKKKQKK